MLYLIHFSKKLAHAQHYVGATTNLDQRLRQHASGQGAKILAACKAKGITWEVVRVWKGLWQIERKLKSLKNAAHYCPRCTPAPSSLTNDDEFPIELIQTPLKDEELK